MYIYYYSYIFLLLCAHIGPLYFDAAKFSVKLFSFIYFTVSVVRQRNEYEIVTEMRPIYIYAFSRRFYPKRLTLHSG